MSEFTTLDILKILLRKIWLILGITVLCAGIALAYSMLFVTPTYQASATLFGNNGAYASNNNTQNGIGINDINASQKIVDTYIQVLQSKSMLDQIRQDTGVSYTRDELSDMIVLATRSNTEVIDVKVTTPNPEDSVKIANTLIDLSSSVIDEKIKVGYISVIDRADTSVQVTPNIKLNLVIGVLLGLVVSILLVLLLAMLDKTIKGEDDITEHYNLIVLGSVPDFENSSKGGYRYNA